MKDTTVLLLAILASARAFAGDNVGLAMFIILSAFVLLFDTLG